MNIPLMDLSRQHESLREEIDQSWKRVLDQTAFSGGCFVEKFEHDFSRYLGIDHVVGVNSGTSALWLALRALEIGSEDEVLLPANTFIASVWPVLYVGAKPVFVDCDPRNWNLSLEDAKKKRSSKTRALIGVHLYGQPFEADPIAGWAQEEGLALIEDACQAHGASYQGKPVGTLGAIGCFSHYPTKNLGACGEAGTLVTQNQDIADRVRCLRNQGRKEANTHVTVGYNMRMDGIQGAILSIKLRHLESWNQRRRAIAHRYRSELASEHLAYQWEVQGGSGVYHLFTITTPQRDRLQEHLSKCGIETRVYYPTPCPFQPALANLSHQRGDFPWAENLAKNGLCLPVFPELTDEEVAFIIHSVNSFFS